MVPPFYLYIDIHMTTYIIIGIVIAIVLLFAKSLKKVNKISKEATMLVAYTKWAGKGKNSILEKEKTQEQFEEDRYERLMQACFLANRFIFITTKDLNRTYHFTIRENGPMYGETIEVQLAPFIAIITRTLNKITESLPLSYQSQVDDYMRNPFSRQNKEKAKEIEDEIFPQDKRIRKYADSLRESIIDSDYLYVLCR